MTLSLAISPCPNDTFIFHAWIAGLVPGAPEVETRLVDIDQLNALAVAGVPDVTKLSFAAFARVRDRYALLHAGGALGRGCGPLLVTRDASAPAAPRRLPAGARIAIPGELTTAALLTRLFLAAECGGEAEPRFEFRRFDRIMPAVAEGEVEAGVIIHESRFTYPSFGLVALVDLGEWWERTTGHPIPLGGIAVRRDVGQTVAAAADRAVRESLLAAWRSPEKAAPFVRVHAQEMDEAVCRQHIDLYVNEFSLDYSVAGRAAIEELFRRAAEAGVTSCDQSAFPLFWDDEAA